MTAPGLIPGQVDAEFPAGLLLIGTPESIREYAASASLS